MNPFDQKTDQTRKRVGQIIALYQKIQTGEIPPPVPHVDIYTQISEQLHVSRDVVKSTLFGFAYREKTSITSQVANGFGRGIPDMLRSVMEGEDRRRIVDALELIALSQYMQIERDAPTLTRAREIVERIAKRPTPATPSR